MTPEERIDMALRLIYDFGGIDGAHHKQWLLDQIVKALSPDYEAWVQEYQNGEYGPITYKWDTGITP